MTGTAYDGRADVLAPFAQPRRQADHLRIWDGATYVSWSWEEWKRRALGFAGGLSGLGIGPGDRVACLLTNSAASCVAPLGTWLAGACVISLPPIARGMEHERYLRMVRRILDTACADLLLCDRSIAGALRDRLDVRVVALESVRAASSFDPSPPGADDPAFVQFSSGSTTEPRGCVLTPGAITWQLSSLERHLRIDPERDVGVVWLPLSHDMGLFGCLLVAYWAGSRLVLGTPERFVARPASWFEDCARFSATVSATPTFGLALAARVARASRPPPCPMRRMIVGAERVDASVIRRAATVLGDERLPWSSLLPAYGLAEAVLAVTMADVGEGPTIVELDRGALAEGLVAEAESGSSGGASVALVSAGRPLPGNTVRVAGAEVGELVISSPSLAAGYLGAPRLAAERFSEQGLRSGDLGFCDGGHYFVCGRTDDLISVAGRNVFARDVETALAAVPGVRPGRCALVDVETDDGPRLVTVVEPERGHPDVQLMANSIDAAARGAGVSVDRCLFLPRGSFPRTPSGKVQRFRCRELAQEPRLSQAKIVSPKRA